MNHERITEFRVHPAGSTGSAPPTNRELHAALTGTLPCHLADEGACVGARYRSRHGKPASRRVLRELRSPAASCGRGLKWQPTHALLEMRTETACRLPNTHGLRKHKAPATHA